MIRFYEIYPESKDTKSKKYLLKKCKSKGIPVTGRGGP
jgi:hypothetical protein